MCRSGFPPHTGCGSQERATGPQTRPQRQRLQLCATKRTQTHKYIKHCTMRAAVLLTAAAPLSTPESPPSQLPTPLPNSKPQPSKLHSCVDPAWSCAAAAAETQDAAHLLALHQRRKMRVQMQQLRRKPLHAHHVRRRNHGNARHADRSCGAPHANASLPSCRSRHAG